MSGEHEESAEVVDLDSYRAARAIADRDAARPERARRIIGAALLATGSAAIVALGAAPVTGLAVFIGGMRRVLGSKKV